MKGMFWFLAKLSNAKTELSKAYDGIQLDKIKIVKQKREKAIKNLRDIQKEDWRYRDEILEDVAEVKAQPWKMTKQQAVAVIREAEKHTEIHKKINATVKGVSLGGIIYIYVPADQLSTPL